MVDIVGSSGHVVGEYGGYEIMIGNPSKFPWKKVFETLLSCSFDVWIEMKDEKMTIFSKPKPV